MAIETTYTAARDQLKALMDRVVADREVVMVRRRQGGAAGDGAPAAFAPRSWHDIVWQAGLGWQTTVP
jgi:hypothetical protein